ncbi:MAG: hypothetical protein AMDU2_EPLC00006G0616 [Thermoplasmatales archaeon E-plasma]|jgi:uncharacterized protein YggU (UPF0235/DUF167 family)|nr:MAG: hypothetical protein AMDU2_EPLC00006G0616 [Thermoplasmatales archaeon E-plasma]MCL4347718.1 hypothetical protein [Candidatus Thermoplasmatota archaeon]MCL5787204.1 hypothetical protein [Candidatus Thermoplasmatota archaeon]
MLLTVKVRSGSGEPIIKDNMIVIFTKAERVNGMANADVIAQIKKLYKTENVFIKTGKTSSRKVIFVGTEKP